MHFLSAISLTALSSALIVVVSAISVLSRVVGPGFFSFIRQSLMGLARSLPERKTTWGIIYDANTKWPVAFAKVQLIDHNRRVLETRIADKDGRYGFLWTPESVNTHDIEVLIVVSQSGYTFPSRTPASSDTLVYNNLYYGQMIHAREGTLINYDVPLDPVRAISSPVAHKAPSILVGSGVAMTADIAFWLGVVTVPLNFILSPNPFTFGTLCMFLGTASLRIFGITDQPFGLVLDKDTRRPVPFALITVNDLAGKRVAFAVSDELGRYFLVVQKGIYDVVVHTPASIIPPRRLSLQIRTRKGWITRELGL